MAPTEKDEELNPTASQQVKEITMDCGLSKYSSLTELCLALDLVNTILLKHSHSTAFTCLLLFGASMA